jgi:hypothetical protein
VTVSNLKLTAGDTPGAGGAIRNVENLTVNQCTVAQNAAGGGGGGIETDATMTDAALTVTKSTISGNTSGGIGGGIHTVGGNLAITDCTVSGNHADNNGGGLGRDGVFPKVFSFTGTGSTFSGNTSGVDGGGIWVMTRDGSSTTLTNCTISGNAANDDGGGVTATTLYLATATIKYCTISGNIADADNAVAGGAGGIFMDQGNPNYGLTLDHTIIAGNERAFVPGPDSSDDVNGHGSAKYSLIGYDPFGLVVNVVGCKIGNLAPIDPKLAALADNGGPTMTRALLSGSPAINAGDPAAVAGVGGVPAFDQRGTPFARVVAGRIDIGAIEFPGPALPGDFDLNGVVDGADHVLWRKTLGAAVPAFTGADGDGDGTIDQDDYNVWRAHFGQTAPAAGAGSAAAAPTFGAFARQASEPVTVFHKNAIVNAADTSGAPLANTADIDSNLNGQDSSSRPPRQFRRSPATESADDFLLLAVDRVRLIPCYNISLADDSCMHNYQTDDDAEIQLLVDNPLSVAFAQWW